MSDRDPVRWCRPIGVYDAYEELLGELSHLAQRLPGGARALYSITPGATGEKPEFPDTRRALPMPFQTLHRNDHSAALRAVTDGRCPCVVAESADGFELLIDRAAIEASQGSVACLEAALRRVLGVSDLRGEGKTLFDGA